ncbi:MAG TPA: ABC transporter ATP-binding protein [Steroidobacteraceae bacterium]|nr:ABC transporter ATP-binding protein [Steroidobacteraceae bacterium]
MTIVIEARGLAKSYGSTRALDGVSFSVESGRILGIIGPNGAGKTTALKAMLGLTHFDGELSVLGRNPRTERDLLMREVCFIADVAVLPKWLRVRQALDFVAGVHPRFDRARAADFLSHTDIRLSSRVRELSKGMVTQLHLALILAIDARLLVLDEPTLGLDLLYRRQFYDTLLNDYFDKERTILLTTHQVEEIENLLTDVIFLSHGRIALASPVEAIAARYMQLTVAPEQAPRVRELKPFYEREVFGRVAMFFEGRTSSELSPYGDVRTPSIADLFVARMQGQPQVIAAAAAAAGPEAQPLAGGQS